MIYTPKHFKPEELLDKATFERFGAEGLRYFRPSILIAIDWIQENYPTKGARSITVNNWHVGGERHWSGLRLPGCPEYKTHSGHSWGSALDIVPSGITMDEMRKWINDFHASVLKEGHADHPILGVRRMEIGTSTWVHLDNLETGTPAITMVSP